MPDKINDTQRLWYPAEDGSGYDLIVQVCGATVPAALNAVGGWLAALPSQVREDNDVDWTENIDDISSVNPDSLQEFINNQVTEAQKKDLLDKLKAKGVETLYIQGWHLEDGINNRLGWNSLVPSDFLKLTTT